MVTMDRYRVTRETTITQYKSRNQMSMERWNWHDYIIELFWGRVYITSVTEWTMHNTQILQATFLPCHMCVLFRSENNNIPENILVPAL